MSSRERRSFRMNGLVGCVLAVCLATAAARDAGAPEMADPALHSYLSANGMLNRGLYELAAVEYRKFLAEHGRHQREPLARYGLAVCLFRMKQYDLAVEELSKLHTVDGFAYAAEVGTMLGQCYLLTGRYAEATGVFGRVVGENGKHELADDAAAGRVEALQLAGMHEEAVKACEAFLEAWTNSPLRHRVQFFAGLAEMSRADLRAAAQRFADVLKRDPEGSWADEASWLLAQCRRHSGALEEAGREYRRIIARSGHTYGAEATYELAVLVYEEGRRDEAGRLLDDLLSRSLDSAVRDSALVLRARVWFDEGEFDRATGALKSAIEAGGEMGDRAAYWLGKCKLRGAEHAAAAEHLREAIRKYPNSELLPEMHYDLAVALWRAGRQDEAVVALMTFRERYGKDELAADALQLLAAIEHERRRYSESKEHCREFLVQYPSHLLASWVAFLSAENSFLAGRHEEAVEELRQFVSQFPDDAQSAKARLRLGMALFRLERFDEAEAILANVVRGADTEPLYRPALLALGDIYFQRSEWKTAEGFLNDYLSTGVDVPWADDALLKLGLCRHRDGRRESAIEAYDSLLRRFPDGSRRLQAMFERGQALVAVGRLEDAALAFEAVARDGDGSVLAPYAWNHLAAIAARRADFAEASRLYERAAQTSVDAALEAEAMFQHAMCRMAAREFEEAQTAFERFLARHAEDERAPQARAQRAIALARQERCAEAVEAVEKSPGVELGVLPSSLRAAVRYERAWCLRSLKRLDDAARVYRELIAHEPRSDPRDHAILDLAAMEMNEGNLERAAMMLRPVRQRLESDLQGVPSDVGEPAMYRLGICEFELQHYEDAASIFESFVSFFPGSPLVSPASYHAGEALFRLGRHEQAVRHLTRVVEVARDDSVAGPALLRLAEALAALQRWARSEQTFADYLDRFRDSEYWFRAQFGLGWARENQKRYDEAIAAYREVVNRHTGPTAARAQFQIGECLFAQNKYQDAVRELLKVDILYAYPEWSAAALYEAGRCFEKLDKPVEAKEQFRRVVDRHGETQWATLAGQRLSGVAGGGLPGR